MLTPYRFTGGIDQVRNRTLPLMRRTVLRIATRRSLTLQNSYQSSQQELRKLELRLGIEPNISSLPKRRVNLFYSRSKNPSIRMNSIVCGLKQCLTFTTFVPSWKKVII